MRFSQTVRLAVAAGLGATAITAVGFAAPAQARVADPGASCLTPTPGPAAGARGGATGLDHRGISAAEQRAIARRTSRRLAAKDATTLSGADALVRRTVPVHIHVMRDAAGRGNVTNRQIARQITVLNRNYSGMGYSFKRMSTHRYKNTAWHNDRQSARYRAKTRKGGARALNIWIVDFAFLGVATFPWDYARKGNVDGIRVNYKSLPGGKIANFNQGKTATHEAGHWFGLYHTFQSGCTPRNDEVNDTPAQSTPTSGCPAGRDSCPMPGSDPIHNYVDYSFDSCYREFTAGQAQRAHKMWAAYRA
jgi:Pregnancy-associated plasma protein-A